MTLALGAPKHTFTGATTNKQYIMKLKWEGETGEVDVCTAEADAAYYLLTKLILLQFLILVYTFSVDCWTVGVHTRWPLEE